MKVRIENLGIIRIAEFELSDFTVIAGKNNTGKTYATYALYAFLSTWQTNIQFKIPNETVTQLYQLGTTNIDIENYLKNAGSTLQRATQRFQRSIPRFLSIREDINPKIGFSIIINKDDLPNVDDIEYSSTLLTKSNKEVLGMEKNIGMRHLTVSFLGETKTTMPHSLISRQLSRALSIMIFGDLFPDTFISSAERTGATIFRTELDFARNRLLDQITNDKSQIDPFTFITDSYSGYAKPIQENVDFIRNLGNIRNQKGELFLKHPSIMEDFSKIVGGKYTIGSESQRTLYFRPSGSRARLTINESASSVRSLVDLGFYLQHTAKPGDLLIVDEPELNLHPDNQRQICRLFAKLINLGIRVLITTHSDYILQELNILILLNGGTKSHSEIANKYHYKKSELLSPEMVRVYTAKKALIKLEKNTRRTRHHTLVESVIGEKRGIEIDNFNDVIEDVREIQDSIAWNL